MADSSLIGRTLGHYRVLEQIGAGGMGVVYRAHDHQLERDVAIKVLPSGVLADEAARNRFRKEARLLVKVSHANIETVHQFESCEGIDFLVTEFIPGVSLDAKLAAGPLPEKEVAHIGVQLATGLQAAHQQGIIHCDLKPANLRLTPEGQLKILDFGLARLSTAEGQAASLATLTRSQEITGTLPYMAPEQLRGERADPRTDVWAIGAVLYELATGKRPFDAKLSAALAADIIHKSPPSPRQLRPDLSEELVTIVLKCLEKEPGKRYQSARELALALQALTSPGSAPQPALPRGKRRAVLAAALVLAAGLVLAYYGGSRSRKPATGERITLAVLPFNVLTGGEDIAFLRVGIADAVITKLSNVGQLRLRPTSAVLRYEKADTDARQAGQSLGADYVATGTVQRMGARFRISAQLIRVNDGAPTWGDHYDLARSDLLGLEDTIADRISAALQVNISSAERERLYRRYTSNPAAYEMYLKGRDQLARFTTESTLAAVAAFEAALREDPQYALAHAGLAMACALMRIRFASAGQMASWEERSRQEAKQALQQDANLAEAHEAMAAVYRYGEFDWDRVIAESREALRLNPSLDMPHYYVAVAFYHLGLPGQAEPEVRAALDVNPTTRAEALRVRGMVALFSGRFAEAEQFFAELAHTSSGALADYGLARTLYYEGRSREAIATLSAVRGGAEAQARAQAGLAALLAAQHQDQQARTLLRKVTAGDIMDHHIAYDVASGYSQLGEVDQGRSWLTRAAKTGFPCYPWFEHDPLLKPLRDDPASRALFQTLRESWEAAKARYAASAPAMP
jgi:TolB-like protein/Tfp pilus assembly protein PilF